MRAGTAPTAWHFPTTFGGDERAAPFRVLVADGRGDEFATIAGSRRSIVRESPHGRVGEGPLVRRVDRRNCACPPTWLDVVTKVFPDYRMFLRRAAAFERLDLNSARPRAGFSAFAQDVLPKERSGTRDFPAVWRKQKELIAALSYPKCVYCEMPIGAARGCTWSTFNLNPAVSQPPRLVGPLGPPISNCGADHLPGDKRFICNWLQRTAAARSAGLQPPDLGSSQNHYFHP